MKNLFVRLAISVLGTALLSSAAYAVQDQITIVIPAIEAPPRAITSSEAILISYLIAQSIRTTFRLDNDLGIEKSAAVLVPPVANGFDIDTASELARINGAQLAFVMRAFREPERTMVSGILSVPDDYDDFRINRFENLILDYGGESVTLHIPNRYVALPDFYFEKAFLEKLSAEDYRQLCPLRPGHCDDQKGSVDKLERCRVLGEDASFFETRRLIMLSNVIVVKEGGKCYQQKRPKKAILEQPVLSFVAGVQRYFAGDWRGVKALMEKVIEPEAQTALKDTNLKLQADLYLARACLRQRMPDKAEKYMRQAEAINADDTMTIETRVFLDLWWSRLSILNHIDDSRGRLQGVEGKLARAPRFVGEKYTPILQALQRAAEEVL